MAAKEPEPQESALYQDAVTNHGEVEATEEKLGTLHDQRDMFRMGKVQRFRRNFNFLSIFAFIMILLSTWEAQLGTIVFGLLNGGTAGLLYMYIVAFFGFLALTLSLAEIASMAPTAGGQYHWVSEFAPPRLQRVLSYYVGWLCVMAWQSGAASTAFLAGTEIQGLIVLNNAGYVYQRWHGTMIVIAISVICVGLNTFFNRHLPLMDRCVLVLHIVGFFAVMVTLLVMAPEKANSHQVWTTFNDGAGWGSTGVACLIGLLSPTISLIGSDAAAHMSEEVWDASLTIPWAMLSTLLFNGALGFAMLITFVYVLGDDLDSIISTPTGYPFIQVFANATGSTAGATVLTCIVIICATFGCVTNVASASRQLYAFARDQGVPFAGFFSYVPPNLAIPLNCVLLTLTVQVLLSLINIGSTIAFNQIVSWGVVAILSSYLIVIGCMAWRRLAHQPLLPRKFSLSGDQDGGLVGGRGIGLAVNLFAMAFLVVDTVFCFFPPQPNPVPDNMNWSALMYGGMLIIATAWFFARARKVYVGPVEYVRKGA